MKVAAYIQVMPRDVSPEVYEGLCALYPAGRGELGFVCKLTHDDFEACRIVEFLETRGVKRNRNCMHGRFKYQLRRIYEETDLFDAKYLAVFPTVWFSLGSTGRDEQGRAAVDVEEVPAEFLIGFVSTGECFVSDSLRRLLVQARFSGPEFRPTRWSNAPPPAFEPLCALGANQHHLPPEVGQHWESRACE